MGKSIRQFSGPTQSMRGEAKIAGKIKQFQRRDPNSPPGGSTA
jgi:hypothetical protein